MIAKETLHALARKYQTSEFPNLIREYFQHLFLSELYTLPDAEKLLFKGGTALRIIYGSPRFSEDLDFTLVGTTHRATKSFVEDLFVKILTRVEQSGAQVEIGDKSNATSGGYFGIATFRAGEYPPVGVEINISSRNGRKLVAEPDSIVSDFVPTYTVLHLAQSDLVEEKVFGALRERKKPRDFYDTYFIMRKGMLSLEQKKRLASEKEFVLADARNMNFQAELEAFLPTDQYPIIRDFAPTLEREFNRQIAVL